MRGVCITSPARPRCWQQCSARSPCVCLEHKASCACDGALLTSQPARLTHSWHDLKQHGPHWLCDSAVEMCFFYFTHGSILLGIVCRFSCLSYKHLWLFVYFLLVSLQAWYTSSDKGGAIILFTSVLPGCSDHHTGSQNLYVQYFRLLTASFLELLSMPS